MGTVVAVKTPTGVAIAGDTRVVNSGSVSSAEFQRVFDLRGVGVGAVGEPGAIQQFGRWLEVELQDRGLQTGDPPELDVIAHIAARETQRAGVDAVVAARDADGVPRLREVAADGRVLDGDAIALGTGREVALGLLEALDTDEGETDPTAAVRNVIETVMERDVDTGGDVDVWALGDADRTERGVRRFEEGAER